MNSNNGISTVEKIEMVEISKLNPYENNARLNDNAVPFVMNSIEQFGFKIPIVVTSGYEIVCGHTRVKAAKRLGMDRVPCVFADDLSEAQIKAFRLADNKVSEIAMWDMEKLDKELASIGEDIKMEDFGFDISIEGMEGPKEEGGFEEKSTEGEEPISRRGCVYSLGDHRLMCGDSTSDEDWAMLMDGEKGDMTFTDPPYGVAIGNKNKELNAKPSPTKGNRSKNRVETNIENDVITPSELHDLLVPAMTNVRLSCKDDACYYVTSPQGGELFGMMLDVMKESGLAVRHILIWLKNQPTFSLNRLDYDYKHEPILYTWTKSHHNYRGGKERTSIWCFDKPRKSRLHPTMKPVELVVNAIMDGTKSGDIVIDAFAGSGTTIIAAEQTKRKAFCMEISPHYCDVIRQRWAQFVGRGEDWEAATPEIR